jgi:hypothetical protein
MVVSPTDLLLFRGTMSTRQFVDKLAQIPGSPPIAGLVLDNSESTQAVCPWTARVWTPDTTIAGQNGAVMATSPTNNASYVAMENLTAPLELGSLDAHTTQYFDGTYGFFALYTKTLTATQHAGLAQLCRQYFRVTL